MALLLLLAFIGVPIIEIAVLIQVGGWIGLWPTLGLIVLTAILGSMELRSQGLATVNKLREQMDRGELPAQTLFDGVCLLFAGALLLTPGFVTDIAGFSLFFPPVRAFLRVTLGSYVARRAEMHVVHGTGPDGGPGGGFRRRDDGVVDADYEDVTPEKETDDDSDSDRQIPR